MRKLTEQSGFTLIEALVAMVILTIGILTLYNMQITAIHGNSTAIQVTRATSAGANQLEGIFAMDYDALQDTNTTGSAANFGLYNFTDATADGMATTPDGYTIYWNVADNQPMPATKRVVVSVVRTDRGVRKSVGYEYIKAQVVQR